MGAAFIVEARPHTVENCGSMLELCYSLLDVFLLLTTVAPNVSDPRSVEVTRPSHSSNLKKRSRLGLAP